MKCLRIVKLYAVRNITLWLTILLFMYAISEYRLDALIARNMGILMYAHVRFSSDIQSKDHWEKIIALLTYDKTANPTNPLTRARLVSSLSAIQNLTTAKKEEENLLALVDRHQYQGCEQDPSFFFKSASLSPNQFNNYLLKFSQDSERWSLHLHKDAIGVLSFIPSSTVNADCIAHISVAVALDANQFIAFQRDVILVPSKKYELSAFVKADEIDKAWLGIKSIWSGTAISNTKDWQHIKFDFQVVNSNPETVQLIIEAGHGTLEIRGVELQIIE